MGNQDLLVCKSVAYAAKNGGGTINGQNEINLLDDGAIAVFNDQNVLVTAGSPATQLSDSKFIYLAVGGVDSDEGARLSTAIPRIGVDYRQQDYAAPVKQKSFVGNDGSTGSSNMPGTITAGMVFEMRITELTGQPENAEHKRRYTHTAVTGSTETTILNALITAINADADRIVDAVAVGATTGIQLTMRYDDRGFTVDCQEDLANADIKENGTGNSVAITYGAGTVADLTPLDDYASTTIGNINSTFLGDKFYSKTTKLVTGATYDIYTYSFTPVKKGAIKDITTLPQTIAVAIPSGAAQIANFETIMAVVFGTYSAEPGTDS